MVRYATKPPADVEAYSTGEMSGIAATRGMVHAECTGRPFRVGEGSAMPLKHAAIFFLNRKFSKIGNYDPGALLDTIGSSTTLIELAGSLGLAEEAKLDQDQVALLL